MSPVCGSRGVEAIGTASALNGVDLTVQLDGVVQKINFKANQDVKQGDILLQMEDSIQRADLAAAEAEAVLAQQNLKRADTLRTRGVGAVSNVDTTASAANAAVALVEKMRASAGAEVGQGSVFGRHRHSEGRYRPVSDAGHGDRYLAEYRYHAH